MLTENDGSDHCLAHWIAHKNLLHDMENLSFKNIFIIY
jgi:hypothetical protein